MHATTLSGPTTTLRKLIEIAMAKNNETFMDLVDHTLEEYDFDDVFYVMDAHDLFPSFTLWTTSHVYFPVCNDMGVKWVTSVPRYPSDVDTMIEV